MTCYDIFNRTILATVWIADSCGAQAESGGPVRRALKSSRAGVVAARPCQAAWVRAGKVDFQVHSEDVHQEHIISFCVL